jgi:hypothetical protein
MLVVPKPHVDAVAVPAPVPALIAILMFNIKSMTKKVTNFNSFSRFPFKFSAFYNSNSEET